MTTEQPYTPSEDLIIEAWKRYSGAQDAKYARLSGGDAGDEARRFIAQVRRDAARDALTAYASDERARAARIEAQNRALGRLRSADAAELFRDRHYPEETS